MKPETLILSAIFVVTICEGLQDHYFRMRSLLGRPGGLGVPLLPPDKRLIPEDMAEERGTSKKLPFLPADKRNRQELQSSPDKRRNLPLLPPDKKTRIPRSHSDQPSFRRAAPLLPTDKRRWSFRSVGEWPSYRLIGKPRRIPLLPPDKREMNSLPDDAFLPFDSLGDDGLQTALKRRPLPFLPPDKKLAESFMNERGWVPRGLRSNKNRMTRGSPIMPPLPGDQANLLDEKDEAVVNLIESASMVLQSLAEKLKSYSELETPAGISFADNDLGKRVPFLEADEVNPDLDDSVALAIAEEELASRRPERSIGYRFKARKEFEKPPRKNLPMLPYDKRTA